MRLLGSGVALPEHLTGRPCLDSFRAVVSPCYCLDRGIMRQRYHECLSPKKKQKKNETVYQSLVRSAPGGAVLHYIPLQVVILKKSMSCDNAT